MAVLAAGVGAANALLNVDTAAPLAGQAHVVRRVIVMYAGGDRLPSGQALLIQSPAGSTLSTLDTDVVVGERFDMEASVQGVTGVTGVVRLVVPAAGAGVRAAAFLLGDTITP